MSAVVVAWSIGVAQILLALAMGCAAFRLLRGPRAQDRIIGLDTLYVNAMLLLLKKIKSRREGRDEDLKHALLDFTLVRRDSDGPPADR